MPCKRTEKREEAMEHGQSVGLLGGKFLQTISKFIDVLE